MAGIYVKPIGAAPGNLLKIDVDPSDAFKRQFTAIEQKHIPAALTRAVVHTAQEMQRDWTKTMSRVFDRPVPFTQKAIRYKLRGGTYGAEIFVRDEASNGTPPARYLQAQVKGGQRLMKPFENRLAAQGILPAGTQAMPGKGVQLDAYGNVPGAMLNRVLSQLGARREEKQNESETSRGRRMKREKKRGDKFGSFFALKQKRGRLLPGIYQRGTAGAAASSALGIRSVLKSIFVFVRKASYKPRYPIFERADHVYRTYFPKYFEHALKTEIDLSKQLRGGK